MSESNSAGSKLNKWLVVATWALVAVGIGSLLLTHSEYRQLIIEQKLSTELEWRPYLEISQRPLTALFKYKSGESDQEITHITPVADIPFGSVAYSGVRSLSYIVPRDIVLRNNGKSPLRIKSWITSTFSKREWQDVYGKSYEALLSRLKAQDEVDTLHTDLIIPSGDSIAKEDMRGNRRTMLKDDWEESVKTEGRITLYPYQYIEYVDFFDHEYNALLIQYMVFDVTVVDSIPEMSDSMKVDIERYRWDIGLHE